MEQATFVIKVVTGGYQAALWAQFDGPNPVLDTAWWDPAAISCPRRSRSTWPATTTPNRSSIYAALDARDDAEVFKAAMGIVQKRLGHGHPVHLAVPRADGHHRRHRVVNIANYTLPDGAKGLDSSRARNPLAQIWLNQ